MSLASPSDPLCRLLTRCVDRGWMPGAAWWVGTATGQPVRRGAVGLASRIPRPEPLTPETPFDLASLTKPLATALLLVLLEQDGRLALDDPVERWLPELRGSRWSATTLMALAGHTAGLAPWRPLYLGPTAADALWATLARLAPVEPAGTVYSDLGYILLGFVVERSSGSALDELFRRTIAGPLGLRRAGFATVPGAFADAAATEQGNDYERALSGTQGRHHSWRTEVIRGEVHDANAHALGGAAGHAGLFGTVDDVAAIATEMLRPSRLALGPEARRRLLEVVPGSDGRTVGCVVASHAAAARGILPDGAPGHCGFTGTSLWLDPGASRVYVLLTNRVHPRVPERGFAILRRGFHRLAQRSFVAEV